MAPVSRVPLNNNNNNAVDPISAVLRDLLDGVDAQIRGDTTGPTGCKPTLITSTQSFNGEDSDESDNESLISTPTKSPESPEVIALSDDSESEAEDDDKGDASQDKDEESNKSLDEAEEEGGEGRCKSGRERIGKQSRLSHLPNMDSEYSDYVRDLVRDDRCSKKSHFEPESLKMGDNF